MAKLLPLIGRAKASARLSGQRAGGSRPGPAPRTAAPPRCARS
jgi:hypothetical protein